MAQKWRLRFNERRRLLQPSHPQHGHAKCAFTLKGNMETFKDLLHPVKFTDFDLECCLISMEPFIVSAFLHKHVFIFSDSFIEQRVGLGRTV